MSQGTRVRPGSELAHLIRHIRLVAFDFDGVFTDNAVYVLEDGREAVRMLLAKIDRPEEPFAPRAVPFSFVPGASLAAPR